MLSCFTLKQYIGQGVSKITVRRHGTYPGYLLISFYTNQSILYLADLTAGSSTGT